MAILKIKDPTTGEWQEVTVMQGKTGPQGPAGPNEITVNTATSINGLLKGAGGKVAAAEDMDVDTSLGDYVSPLVLIAMLEQYVQMTVDLYERTDYPMIKKSDGSLLEAAIPGTDYVAPPTPETSLPASGTALTANTIYAVTTAVGTYAFTPPATGWAHGMFTADSSVSVSFSGTFMGAAPAIKANKTYEFDVYNGVWAVQEVVSA